MKSKIIKWGFGCVALLIVAISVVAFTFKLPEFTGIESLAIVSNAGDQIATQLKCRIENDNFFALTASDLEYVISYHDTVVAIGTKESLSLPAGEESIQDLNADVELGSLLSLYPHLKNKRRSKFDILLSGNFSWWKIRHSLELEVEINAAEFIETAMKEALDKAAPEFERIKWRKVSPTASLLEFTGVFQNPFPIEYTVDSIQMQFSAKGIRKEVMSDWSVLEPINLRAEKMAKVKGEMKIDHLEAGKDFFRNAFKRKLTYYTWGSIAVTVAEINAIIPIEGKFILDPLSQDWSFIPL